MSNENNRLIKTIILLAMPTVIEQALQTIVSYVDTAMVGKISADASAAVGLTLTVNWLVNAPFFALGIGILSYIARAMGAKDFENVNATGSQAIIMTLISGIVLGVITMGISPFLPYWLGAEENIVHMTSWYFFITSFPMVFRAAGIILASALRAVHDSKTPMIINIIMNIVNVVLNVILIRYFGVYGAALATAISYTAGGTLMFIALFKNPYIAPAGRKIRYNSAVMMNCLKTGFPIALERVASCLGHVVFTALVSNLGTIAIAAHSIALTAEEAFYIPGYGMQAAASTLSGNALGEKNGKKLVKTSLILTAIAVAVITALSTFLFFYPSFMMSLFSNNAQVIEMGASVLKLVALSEPLFAVLIILEGVFNGIGDTKTTFITTVISMWGVRILSTFICINAFDANLKMVWMCMIADNVFKCSVFAIRYIKRIFIPARKTDSDFVIKKGARNN